jgi:hypothetical protein
MSTVGETASQVRWSLPGMPESATIIDLMTCQHWLSDLRDLRMQHIECNSPIVSGYSAYCTAKEVIYLRSHGSSDMNCIYNQGIGRPDGVWIYFPMNQGESLQAIISRTREEWDLSHADTSLIVSCKAISVEQRLTSDVSSKQIAGGWLYSAPIFHTFQNTDFSVSVLYLPNSRLKYISTYLNHVAKVKSPSLAAI